MNIPGRALKTILGGLLLGLGACSASSPQFIGSPEQPDGMTVDPGYCDRFCQAAAQAGTLNGSAQDCMNQCCATTPQGCSDVDSGAPSDDGGGDATACAAPCGSQCCEPGQVCQDGVGGQLSCGTAPAADASSCAKATCGDSICTAGCESYATCPGDCGALVYSDNSVRRTTSTGDWSPGNNKAECGVHQAMTGLSVEQSGFPFQTTHAALCGADDSSLYTHEGCAPVFFGSSDNRQDTSTGDWDPGAAKGECAAGSYAAGVDENLGTAVTILCCPGTKLGKTGCTPEVFWQAGARERGTLSVDWDPGYFEGECGSGRYVAGVSHSGISGLNQGTRTVLCCSP
jgi:hypothetical protein